MIPALLGSLALGLVKGLTSGPSSDEPSDFSLQQDLVGPVTEELIYRGAPLWLWPKIPFGSTAIVIAAAHLEDDWLAAQKAGKTLTPGQVLARLGDTFLGGLLYETAMRQSGIGAAVGAHAAHNIAITLGSRMRR